MPAAAPRSWIWLLALFTAAGFIETIFWGQMSSFTPLYLPRFGIPPAAIPQWTGYIASLSILLGIPFLPFWGALADRYSRQPIIVRSFVAHLLAGAVAMLAGNVWVFILGRALMSFALGNTGLMMTTLAERTPRNRIGLAFTIMNSASPIGAFLGPLMGGPVVDRWGFPALLSVNVVLMAIVIVALTFGYRDTYQGADRGPLLQMAVDSVRLITRSARLRALFPALFLMNAGWMLAYTYVPLATTQMYRGNAPGTAVGLVMGAGGLITLLLGPLVGALGDRLGHWKTLFAGAAVTVVLWPLPMLAPNLFAFGALWAVINALASAIFALSFTVLSDSTSTEARGRVMSFSYLPVNLGIMIGPAIGTLVTRNSIFLVFPTAALITLLSIGALFIASRQPVDFAPTPAT